MTLELAGLGWLPWRPALASSLILLVLAIALYRSPRTKPTGLLSFEVGLVLGLYAAWQFINAMTPFGVESAGDAGRWIAAFQEAIGLPSEAALQALVLSNDVLIQAADTYYTALHIPVFVITLIWVLVRHRPEWPFVRTTTALVTGFCLAISFRAVAPPRLIPDLGIVDTATENGRSVYAAIPGANQLSAMPSVHIAWAAAVALFIIVVARTRGRWLALLYPITTLWVVIVTGNHFILDGLVAIILLGVAAGLTLLFPSQRPSRMAPRATVADDPTTAPQPLP